MSGTLHRGGFGQPACLAENGTRAVSQRKGREEHRAPGRLRVVLDLTHAEPGAGLANQLYGLVAMLALGLETGCEIVLPPAHRRNGTYAVRCTC